VSHRSGASGSLVTAIVIIMATAGSAFADGHEEVNLQSFNGSPVTPVDLPFQGEGFFVLYDPGTEAEFHILSASVWICGRQDQGWPFPDAVHESFTMALYETNGTALGRQIYSVNIIAGDNFPNWVTINPNVACTGKFFLGSIQRADDPSVEAVMIDDHVDHPEIFWTNRSHDWGKCVDVLEDFSGDILTKCTIDRPTGVALEREPLPPVEVALVSPNPFNGSALISVRMGLAGSARLMVTDALGRVVGNRSYSQLGMGVSLLPLPLEAASSGRYWAVVQIGARAYNLPVVKLK
jgi:hypothetical protein